MQIDSNSLWSTLKTEPAKEPIDPQLQAIYDKLAQEVGKPPTVIEPDPSAPKLPLPSWWPKPKEIPVDPYMPLRPAPKNPLAPDWPGDPWHTPAKPEPRLPFPWIRNPSEIDGNLVMYYRETWINIMTGERISIPIDATPKIVLL